MEPQGVARPPAKPAPPPPGVEQGGGTFGKILLDLGLLTEQQLTRALEVQRERSRRGDFARLGHILVEQGFLTPAQVQQVLQAQAIKIMACEACGSQYNIRGWSPTTAYDCSKCRGKLRPQEELKSVAVQDQISATGQKDEVASNTAKIRALKSLGKYEILGEIARGGMGIIYKARQMDLDRVVALKTLRKEELTKPDAAQRFRGEAQAIANLRHPNIVAVHEVGTQDGIEYFTMEFIEGLPLDRILLRERLAPRRAVELVLPIAEALEYAHRGAVVHRDLKPGNIIVDLQGTPFLVDFGIAKRITKRLERDDEEDLLGSIPYMAPEYVEGAAYDELCDLYSLGVVLYEALCGPGTLPVYDDDTRRFLEKIVRCEHQPIRERLPDLDPALAKIVDGMIAPKPRRFPSMKVVAEELRRWLARPAMGEQPPPLVAPQDLASPSAGTRTEPRPGDASQPVLVKALAAGLVLAGLLVGWQAVSLQRTAARLEELERRHQDELGRELLAAAKALQAAGKADEALAAAGRAIGRLDPRGDATGPWPTLADLYELRAGLRPSAEAAAADDARRAKALR